MLYRETGQYKTSYAADQALFPIRLDRLGMALILVAPSSPIPLFGSDFFITTVMIPFLVFALAAIGLNLLTGYAGQLSLGTGGFMGVGAYACYKLATLLPDANILVLLLARACSRRGSASCSACRRCGSRDSISWWRRWRRSSSSTGASTGSAGSTTTTPAVPSRCRRGGVRRRAVTGPTATPLARYYALLAHRRAADLARLQPRPRPDRPRPG